MNYRKAHPEFHQKDHKVHVRDERLKDKKQELLIREQVIFSWAMTENHKSFVIFNARLLSSTNEINSSNYRLIKIK